MLRLAPAAARTVVDLSYSRHFLDFQGSAIPRAMQKLVVTRLSPRFRDAVALRRDCPVPLPGDGDLLVRNRPLSTPSRSPNKTGGTQRGRLPARPTRRHPRVLRDMVVSGAGTARTTATFRFVGINASDINYSAGRYDPTVKPPFDLGFEGIGEVVGLGLSASARYTVGQAVAYMAPGSFAEYTVVPARHATPVPSVKPEYLTLLVSGTTAHISLNELGELSEGKKVLVTAAAGGTGQFAVQLSKKAKCHVIGTCSSDEKSAFLKSLGCDRPINYKTESVRTLLKHEYPEGIDVVYESVGGAMFDLAVDALATKGRLIVIGFISGYQSPTGLPPVNAGTLPAKLLKKSASVHGFFLNHYLSKYQAAMAHLLQLYASGDLVCEVDLGDLSPEGRFIGLNSIFRAVDYMYMGKNTGKIVVELPHSVNSKL
ncbi:LOW QUALITY PROTEIN: prostaglandin reductase 3 [Ctenodactylus gundi]